MKISLLLTFYFITSNLFANDLITSVPFQLIGERIYFQLSINNSRPLNFVYDTGAGSTVIDSRLVPGIELLGLRKKEVEVTGNGGSIDAQHFFGNKISIGDLNLNDIKVVIVPMDNLRRKYFKGIDGVIGNDLTEKYVIDINYDSMLLSFYDPEGYIYTGSGERIEMAKKSDGRFFIKTSLTLKNYQLIDGLFLVDCGAINNRIEYRTVKKHKIDPQREDYYESNLYGISQQLTQLKVVRTEFLIIGSVEFTNFPILLKPNDKKNRKRIGGIGNNVFKRFNMVIDYPHSQFYLAPNKLFDSSYGINCSGFELIYTEDKQFLVVDNIISEDMLPDLTPGDTLTSINQKAVNTIRISEVNELLMKNGEEVSLEFNSGVHMKSYELILKELI